MNNKDGTRNQMKRKISVILLSAAMVITGISVSCVYATGDETPVTVSKTARWGDTAAERDEGIAKVTLNVRAKDIETVIPTELTTRVVLVLDISSSMNKNGKLAEMKTAAKKFCEDLLAVENVQIAVTVYGNNPEQISEFRGADRKYDLLNAISGIQEMQNQGTNIQGGIAQAQKLLTEISADNKIMVVLSDGEPTYSYKGTSAVRADSKYNYDSQTWPYRLTEFDAAKIGSGGSYNLGMWRNYKLNLADSEEKADIDNNGFGTVSQAYLAKKSGITIYSVGFDVTEKSNAEKVMKSVAGQPEYYLSAGTSDLKLAFESIKEDVIKKTAGTAAVVTDQIGSSKTENKEYKFTALNDENHKPQISGPDGVTGAEIIYDDSSDTFTWKLTGGELKQGTYTLSYYVKLNLEDMTGSYGRQLQKVLTNNSAQLKYTDNDACEQTIDFEKPELPITHYSVEYYYSDDSGKNYTKDDSKTLTFAAVSGCSDKTVSNETVEKGQKSGYDFEPEKTRYGTGDDENSKALTIKDDENKNTVRLYFKKYKATGSVTLKAQKNYNALLQGNDFEFSAVETDQSGVPLDGASEIKAFNNPQGAVLFPVQNFDETGIGKTHYYRITEEADPFRSSISFSDQVYLAAVSIKDSKAHDGTLSVETVYYRLENGEKTKLEGEAVPLFTNTFNMQPAEINFKLNKKLTGKTLEDNQFSFDLIETDSNGRTLDNGERQSAENKADGTIAFDKIAFTEAGTHYYLITEENGGKEIDRIRYDDMSVMITVNVRDDGNGKLVAEADYPDDTTFDNNYIKPDTPPAHRGSITVTKTVTADGKPACTDHVFYVALFADEQYKIPDSAVKEIKMSGSHEASVEFSGLSYGTYYPAETDSSGHALTPEESEAAGFIGTFSQSAIKVSGSETVHVCLENKLIPDDNPEEPGDDSGDGTIEDPGENVDENTGPEPVSEIVSTGDQSELFIWTAILITVLSALSAAIVFRRKAR